MDTRFRRQMVSIFNFFIVNPNTPDENFYGLEEYLAMELAAPPPQNLEPTPLPEIEPEEFEQQYGWFLA